MKEKYCITIGFKVLIAQFILSTIGLIIGCMLGLNIENKKWSELIYNNVKIAGINVGGKTKEEARNIIKSQYIDRIPNKKMYVTVNGKQYFVENSSLIKSYDIEYAIDEAFDFGKNLNIIEKHKLIKSGSGNTYNLDLTFNDALVKSFVSSIEEGNNKNAVNAAIKLNSDGVINIQPDVKGYKINEGKLEKYIEDKIKTDANEDIYINAPVQDTEAAITEKSLALINSCISSFSTSFQTSTFMRAKNINICIKAIDGVILMPGESFSFNDVVGERTKERGYMEAPVIIGDKIESGIGGGICQVSTTLYNAILRTGIEHIERTHHSLPSSYVGIGLDATVDWGKIDFKFTNTLDYPIYIQGYTENKNLYINIFSNSNLKKKQYTIENNINENDSLCKVKVIRKTYENGAIINSEIISNDVYAKEGIGPRKEVKIK